MKLNFNPDAVLRIFLISSFSFIMTLVSSAQQVPGKNDTIKEIMKSAVSVRDKKAGGQKVQNHRSGVNVKKTDSTGNKVIKKVNSTIPDLSKSTGSKPNIVRPAGSGVPKGKGVPGGSTGQPAKK